MALNPNWPVMQDLVAFGQGYNGGVVTAAYTDLSRRTKSRQGTTRGRLYERDQVRTGRGTGTWRNRDGALDPSNTGSPFAGLGLDAPWQKRAQWPPTVNLLTADQATGGEATPLSGAVTNTSVISGQYGTPTALVSAGAWQGTQVWSVAVPANPTANQAVVNLVVPVEANTGLAPAVTYTWSAYVADITPATSTNLGAVINWFEPNGTYISTSIQSVVTITGNATPTYTRLSASGSPPTGAAYASIAIAQANSPTAATTIYVDGLQFEANTAASTWVRPGTWYPVMSGWVERWPQTWKLSGTYGMTGAVLTDTFAFLSQRTMQDPFIEQVLSLTPNFFLSLGDPAAGAAGAAGVTIGAVSDLSGNLMPAPITQAPGGPGSLTLGNAVQSTTAAGGIAGYTGTVATFANHPTSTGSNAQTYIDLASGRTPGPPNLAGGGAWTRILAFQAPAAPTSGQKYNIWTSNPASFQSAGNLSAFFVAVNGSTGTLTMQVAGAANNGVGYTSASSICDGSWHLVTLGVSYSGTASSGTLSVDGTVVATASNPSAPYWPSGCASDAVGCGITLGTNAFNWGFVGQAAFVAEVPSLLTAGQIATLYSGFRSGFTGDSTGTRYGRIAAWAGFHGPTALDTGVTSSMGPATDITGLSALSALQGVVTTENGNHYVARDGTLTFKARSARYNQLTPVYTFGENTAAGEWPYEDLRLDFDPTKLITQAQITQYASTLYTNSFGGVSSSTGQVFQYPPAGSAAQTAYGQYTLQRTINSSSMTECVAAGQYLVGKNQQPRQRIEAIRLHPAAFPTMWPVCLSLELGTRVRVMRRPQSPAATIQVDGFVEQIAWTFSGDGDKVTDAYLDLMISPADLSQYWLLAALHGALKNSASSGQNQIVCNPLPDSATNAFGGSIPSGLQITLEPGTANAETLTVQSVSATSPGYASATVTFTANLAHTHAASSTWCEALPAGFTNPATWDPVSLLGSTTILAY